LALTGDSGQFGVKKRQKKLQKVKNLANSQLFQA
jgi:hypothetical protein